MNKKFFIALLVVSIFTTAMAPVMAQGNDCPSGQLTLKVDANIRSNPGGSQSGSVPSGSIVTALGNCQHAKLNGVDYNWVQVETDDLTGWIFDGAFEESETVNALPETDNDESCIPNVTLTSNGVEVSGCNLESLSETAQDMSEESNPVATDLDEGVWEIRWFAGTTDQMRGLGNNPWPTFTPAQPELWPEFPNINNTTAQFLAKDGLEYGMAESDYMQNDIGDMVVAARHYRLVTGDYNLGFDQCVAGEEFQGCAIAMFNVGEVTSNFEDISVNNAFTVWGRYWNGDTLPIAITALLSHAGNNMLNLDSTLNPGGTNAGANCSVPTGCERVRLTFVILSGNEVLGIGRTYISR